MHSALTKLAQLLHTVCRPA